MWGHKEKVAICRPGREFSLETHPCWQLDFGLPRLQKGEKIHFCCWSHQSAVFCYDRQSWPGRALGEERRGRTASTANPWQCLLSRRSGGVSAGRGEATPTQQTLQSGIDWNTAIRRNSTFYHESWLTQAGVSQAEFEPELCYMPAVWLWESELTSLVSFSHLSNESHDHIYSTLAVCVYTVLLI